MTEVAWKYEETIEKLQKQFLQTGTGNYWTRLFIISYASGAREGEIYQMKHSDIRFGTSPKGNAFLTFFIHSEKHADKDVRVMIINPGKNEKEKWLFETIKKILESWKPAPNNPNNFLFFMPYKAHKNKLMNGQNWPKQYFCRMARYATNRVLGCNHHWLRHCRAYHFATDLKQSAHAIQKAFGWRRLSTSEHYIALDTSDLEKEMGVE